MASLKSDESCGFAKRSRQDNPSVKPVQEKKDWELEQKYQQNKLKHA